MEEAVPPSAESSLSSRPSLGVTHMSSLELPDLPTVNLTTAVRGISRKRPKRNINVSAFERKVVGQSGDGPEDGELEQSGDRSAMSGVSPSSLSLSLKTPYLDLRTERTRLQRKAGKRKAISVEDFEAGVHDHLAKKKVPDREQSLSETAGMEKFTLGLSNASAANFSSIVMSNTALYPPPVSTTPHAPQPSIAIHDKDTVTSSQIQRDLERGGGRIQEEVEEVKQQDEIQEDCTEGSGRQGDKLAMDGGEKVGVTGGSFNADIEDAEDEQGEEEAGRAGEVEAAEFMKDPEEQGAEEVTVESEAQSDEVAESEREEEEADIEFESSMEEGLKSTSLEPVNEQGAALKSPGTPDDGEATESETQEDGGATESETQEDEGGTESETQEDGGATESETQEDGGATESETQEDEGGTESEMQEDGGASVSEREEDGGASVSEREEDGGATESEMEKDGGASVSELEEDGGATESEMEKDGGASVSELQEDGGASESEIEEDEGATKSETREVAPGEDMVRGLEHVSRRAYHSERLMKIYRMAAGTRGYKSLSGGLHPVVTELEGGEGEAEPVRPSVGGASSEWHSMPGEGSLAVGDLPSLATSPNEIPPSQEDLISGEGRSALEVEVSVEEEEEEEEGKEEMGEEGEVEDEWEDMDGPASAEEAEDKENSIPLVQPGSPEIELLSSRTLHTSASAGPHAASQTEEDNGEEEESDLSQDEELPLKTPAFVRERRHVATPGPATTPDLLKQMMEVRKQMQATAPAAKPKPQRKGRAGPSQKAPGLPKSYVMSTFKHFAKTTVSSDCFPLLKDIMAKYFERLADDLEAYAMHAKRKTIEVEDVELLMRRQGFVTDSMPVNVLIEKYLPYEYRRLLIPVATSGNKVIPKLRR
ncbi:hypothetical protein GJAV_G00064110 [Gymnothorax javanicus]|nr:hypothetical protein GJAV_G00064110 [Gymnothorax javanicus]